jgi:hypothetical protein
VSPGILKCPLVSSSFSPCILKCPLVSSVSPLVSSNIPRYPHCPPGILQCFSLFSLLLLYLSVFRKYPTYPTNQKPQIVSFNSKKITQSAKIVFRGVTLARGRGQHRLLRWSGQHIPCTELYSRVQTKSLISTFHGDRRLPYTCESDL